MREFCMSDFNNAIEGKAIATQRSLFPATIELAPAMLFY